MLSETPPTTDSMAESNENPKTEKTHLKLLKYYGPVAQLG